MKRGGGVEEDWRRHEKMREMPEQDVSAYRVSHTIRYMDGADLHLIVPPFCLAAQPLLPNSH